MSTKYNPAEVESRIYEFWEKGRYFRAEDRSTRPKFCIILPPPNVTGHLHLGHAFDHTIQDTLIRWKRMSGFNTLWAPGTDHAGIATQSVVERHLEQEGVQRKELGREAFLEKIWEWKQTYGHRIIEQMKRLGDSCDWSRLKFTLDASVSKAVRKVFVELYSKGYIYRGERLVNWDPHLETSVSDLEVEHQEKRGFLWHIRYLIEGSDRFLTIATTRPETLLGDMAVAVHPEDERYRRIVGKTVLLPLLKRRIPIIADEYVDKTFGSGAVKITPAHDFNDYEMGQRHKLEALNILNPDGTLNEKCGPYKGLKVSEARKRVVEDLIENNLLEKKEPHKYVIPICQRSGSTIEPYLSQQWFVSVDHLAGPAKSVVESGTITFEPETWTKTYLHWMRNIQDWCISRQLWWGHRIPAWHCKDCEFISVSEEDVVACEKCKSKNIIQDEDVLDTWFSSALWPFSLLGWPNKTEGLKTFYPTDVLVTGHDIIFFWVARMIMQGLEFTKEVPFRKVYIHGVIRDSLGRKMSKSVGNTLDPIEMIDKYGADALRFTLLSQVASGKDLKFSEKRLEGYRNFMNKIWNVTRFSLNVLKDFKDDKKLPPPSEISSYDRWIIYRLKELEKHIHVVFEHNRFSEVAQALYSFVWHDFCDWYIECIKPIVYIKKSDAHSDLGGIKRDLDNHHKENTGHEEGNGKERAAYSKRNHFIDKTVEEASRKATLKVLAHTLNRIVRLLHPLTPFITEEIYSRLPIKNKALIIDSYPTIENDEEFLKLALDENGSVHKSYDEINFVNACVSKIRNMRAELGVSVGKRIKVDFAIVGVQGWKRDEAGLTVRSGEHDESVERLAHLQRKTKDSNEIIGEAIERKLLDKKIGRYEKYQNKSIKELQKILEEYKSAVERLAHLQASTIYTLKENLESINCAIEPVMYVDSLKDDIVGTVFIKISLEGLVDIDKEVIRLEKKILCIEKESRSLVGRLKNKNFRKNAPEHIIQKDESRGAELLHKAFEYGASLNRLQPHEEQIRDKRNILIKKSENVQEELRPFVSKKGQYKSFL